MKIYSFPYSLPSYRVRLAASVMGFDSEIEDINIAEGQQKEEQYLKINPLGKIPAIQDDEVVVTDSLSILRYLARKHASRNWYPEDQPELAARVDTLLSLVANELYDSVEKGRLIKAFKMLPDSEHDNCVEVGGTVLTYLNTLLEGQDVLVLDVPTIADVAVLSTLLYAGEAHISLEEYPNISRWMQSLTQVEGFIAPVQL